MIEQSEVGPEQTRMASEPQPYDLITNVDTAAFHIRYACGLLRGTEMYREDIVILSEALKELQVVVVEAAHRGKTAALLKARHVAQKDRAEEASIVQRGADPAADLLRAANQVGG